MHVNWTAEQVLGLCETVSLMRSGRILAAPEKWNSLATHADLIWGHFIVPNRAPFNSAIHLPTLSAYCSCRQQHFPCNHVIGLALLAIEHPQRFPQATPPPWATVEPVAQLGPSDADYAVRLRALRRGMTKLALWLQDMVRSGLAQLANRPKLYWHDIAAQLVDSYAPTVAQTVRAWPTIVSEDANWVDTLLREIGRLYLLTQAFERFDQLPLTTQNDMLIAVGWQPASSADDICIDDDWLVLGRTTHSSGKRITRQTWLWGRDSGQPAIITQVAHEKRKPVAILPTGVEVHAQLRFFASSAPLHARVESRTLTKQPELFVRSERRISSAHSRFTNNLQQNPWQTPMPLVINQCAARPIDTRWHLQDADGYLLPLPVELEHCWHLQALAGRPLAGIWDGTQFEPLSVWTAGQLMDFRLLKGVAQ